MSGVLSSRDESSGALAVSAGGGGRRAARRRRRRRLRRGRLGPARRRAHAGGARATRARAGGAAAGSDGARVSPSLSTVLGEAALCFVCARLTSDELGYPGCSPRGGRGDVAAHLAENGDGGAVGARRPAAARRRRRRRRRGRVGDSMFHAGTIHRSSTRSTATRRSTSCTAASASRRSRPRRPVPPRGAGCRRRSSSRSRRRAELVASSGMIGNGSERGLDDLADDDGFDARGASGRAPPRARGSAASSAPRRAAARARRRVRAVRQPLSLFWRRHRCRLCHGRFCDECSPVRPPPVDERVGVGCYDARGDSSPRRTSRGHWWEVERHSRHRAARGGEAAAAAAAAAAPLGGRRRAARLERRHGADGEQLGTFECTAAAARRRHGRPRQHRFAPSLLLPRPVFLLAHVPLRRAPEARRRGGVTTCVTPPPPRRPARRRSATSAFFLWLAVAPRRRECRFRRTRRRSACSSPGSFQHRTQHARRRRARDWHWARACQVRVSDTT